MLLYYNRFETGKPTCICTQLNNDSTIYSMLIDRWIAPSKCWDLVFKRRRRGAWRL